MIRRGLAIAALLLGCDDGGAAQDPVLDAATGDVATPDGATADAEPPPPPEAALVGPDEALDLVDPFIGSGGLGFAYAALTPAAQWPNGMVRLGPDTTRAGRHFEAHHFCGYHYDDPDVRGFSHLRLVGTGAGDLGLLRVRPMSARYTPIDKTTERASPGRYAARLPDIGVSVELTSTLRGGVHRYTYDAPGALVFDTGSSIEDAQVEASEVEVDGGTVEGSVTWGGGFSARSGAYTVYFSATVDPPPTSAERVDAEALLGVEAGTVEVRLAVSYVSLEQARVNRAAELDGRGFEDVAAEARAAWREKLARVRVAGGARALRAAFYTALYHAYAMPTRFDEVGGVYLGMDREVHRADGFRYFSDLSLWDTFRTLHPWLELTDPDLERDVLRSLLRMHTDGGRMPRWPAGPSYTGSMIGSSADLLFAGGALKGIDGVDYEAAFDAIRDGGRRDVQADYLEHGYVPDDRHDESVSRTLEYAYADWAQGLLAAHLGRPEADALAERGRAWRRLFNPESGFLDPRNADGGFAPVPRRTAVYMRDGPYTEGSAWHWRFYAPHDVAGLAEALGGERALLAELDTFFDLSGVGDGLLAPARPDPYYWHGNEPDLHAAWMYVELGRPELAAARVRAIVDRLYLVEPPAGIPGNDDGGTLSAWLLFSALGLYPVAGSDVYLLGEPLFERAELDLAGAVLTIRRDPTAEGLTLDGEPTARRVRHADLLGATELVFGRP